MRAGNINFTGLHLRCGYIVRKAVPFATPWATPCPFGAYKATVSTRKRRFLLSHLVNFCRFFKHYNFVQLTTPFILSSSKDGQLIREGFNVSELTHQQPTFICKQSFDELRMKGVVSCFVFLIVRLPILALPATFNID